MIRWLASCCACTMTAWRCSGLRLESCWSMVNNIEGYEYV
jgi:hypothetical protein